MRRDVLSVRGGRAVFAVLLACLALLSACGAVNGSRVPQDIADIRKHAAGSQDANVSARWLLLELVESGGDAAQARRARKQLDDTGEHGMLQDLARGLDDAVHGRLASVSDHYLRAAQAARRSQRPEAELLAQFAVENAIAHSSMAVDLWPRWKRWVEAALSDPGSLGWRAREQLVQWWIDEAWDAAHSDIEEQAVLKLGCIQEVRLAGPFGTGVRADYLRSFSAERLSPWPAEFPAEPAWVSKPRVLKTDRTGCTVEADEAIDPGAFYAETLVDLATPSDAILFVQGALKLWVDGSLVLDRDLREWGSWTRVGAGVRLDQGTHRIVARLMEPRTAIRIMDRKGVPLAVNTHHSLQPLPRLSAPETFEANALRAYVHSSGVRQPADPALAYVAASLAHSDGEADVAALLIEPLVKDQGRASGPSLALAASFVPGDPIFDGSQTKDLVRGLHQLALKKDPQLWLSELSAAEHRVASKGLAEGVVSLRTLSNKYQEVPALLHALSTAYGRLGWSAQYDATVKLHADRFPNDVAGLYAAARVYEKSGDRQRAEELWDRIRKLDPDSEVGVGLSLERADYAGAIRELKRLLARRPTRKDLRERIDEIARQRGDPVDILDILRAQVKRESRAGIPRLELADARYAAGEKAALREGIVDAIQAGADTTPLKAALDLLENSTELDNYRLDGRAVIAEYERSGRQMSGAAARVLDYAALWIREDGSSQMLEHEVIRIQSEEAIDRFAEQNIQGGGVSTLVLQMRVIKQDGRILEPEPVAGKPTVTLPHLEVGDYIETETVYGRGASGPVYDGPRWWFREKDVGYARSEFVVISPVHKPLDIETTGVVPEPEYRREGYLEVRRWRVDFSPPAPSEPMSVPHTEYLPSVSVSWGVDLQKQLRFLSDRVERSTPIDPRIVRIAEKIVQPIPESSPLQRAERLYNWVLDNVQDGEEDDGRRVVVGKRGNRWRALATLCQSLGIDVRWAIARNRLSSEPRGPADEAKQYSNPVLRVGGKHPAWVVMEDRYAPFGYVPAAVRGMKAYLLGPGEPVSEVIPSGGAQDGLTLRGTGKLLADGSLTLALAQSYSGRLAATLRKGFAEVAESRLHDTLESQLIGSNLPGARLLSHQLQNLERMPKPLVVRMDLELHRFAHVHGGSLTIDPPYATRLGSLASLQARQTAMLFSAERVQDIEITINLPQGASARVHPKTRFKFKGFEVHVEDRVGPGQLILKRRVTVPATRVSTADYPKFAEFARAAEAALTRQVVVKLP